MTLPVTRFSRYGVEKMPSSAGNSPSVSTELERILLRAFSGREEVRLVLDDRPAKRATELIAAVILLFRFVDLFGFGDGVHRRVAEQREEAAARAFVPLLVTMFITPPLLRPYSAFERDVIMLNS